MKLAVGNGQHIGDRQEQQDAFGFSDPGNGAFLAHGGLLGIVADGMGGLSHGSDASHSAVKTFLHEYELKTPDESIPDALSRALNAANRAVVDLAGHFGTRNGTGTTLAAAVVHGDTLHWISAGDSRVYLCRRKNLIRVTSDHVYAQQLNEEAAKGKISRAEAESNEERAGLTSFLGDLKDVDRNRQPYPMSPGDRVILCSDGLYRAVTDGEMAAAFQHDPQTACDTLVQQALAKQRQHQDNLTIIAFSSQDRPSWPPGALNRTLAILTGVLILGSLAAGIYTGLWSRKHNSPTKTAAPGNSGAGTTAGAAPTPFRKANSLPQSEKSTPPPEKVREQASSRSAKSNAKAADSKAGLGRPGIQPPGSQGPTAKQQSKPNPPALNSEPAVPQTPQGNPPAGENQLPADSQAAPSAVAPESPPVVGGTGSKGGSDSAASPVVPPTPGPTPASPAAAQPGQNGSSNSPADAGKPSDTAPGSQPQVPPPNVGTAEPPGNPSARRVLGL